MVRSKAVDGAARFPLFGFPVGEVVVPLLPPEEVELGEEVRVVVALVPFDGVSS